MDAASWARAKDVLAEVLKKPQLEREEFVASQGLPPEVRDKVLEILSAWVDSTDFLRSDGPIRVFADDADVLQPGTRVKAYVVVDQVGSGGMGRVYLANDPQLRRKVALKCLIATSGGRPDATIINEAIAAARVNHPNVAQVYHVIEDNQQVFIVMEYVDGENLAARLRRDRMKALDVVSIGQRLASALVAAHSKGIIHRDLKPGNVQFTHDGIPKVLDFGIANLAMTMTVTSNASTTGAADAPKGPHPGTPPYMSPEQLQGRDVDERSDLFSLGVLLFEMATGRRPFQSTEREEIEKLQAKGAPRADTLAPGVPRSLADVIGRLLEPDRDRRLQSAREVEASLDEVARKLLAKSKRELVRLWAARVVIGVPLVVIGLGVLGEFKTLTFNNNFGRTGPFARFGVEPWPALLLWGLAGTGSKLLVMTVMTVIVFAARSVFRTLERLGPVGRVTGPLRTSCRNGARALNLDNTLVLAQTIAGLGVLLMLVVAWRHLDLMNAWTVSFNSAPIEKLMPMRESSFERFQYHFELSLVMLVMCFGVFGVVLRSRREGSTNGRLAMVIVAAVLAAVVLLDDAPFRSFNYRDFERVEYGGLRCYNIGNNGEEFLILCPGSDPPRNRAVRRDDPQLKRPGIIENVFRGVNPARPGP